MDGNRRSEGPSTAHEYLRVSVDGSELEESQDEQHTENERVRVAEGWEQGRTYRDTGSASRYARKARGDFDKLLKDLRSGSVFHAGDLLFLWESSRGSREQVEWATFLNLLRDNQVRLYVTSHERVYDLTNPRDRKSLDEDGSAAAYESALTSIRQRRHVAANAVKGRPHGRVAFGYRRVYSAKTGRLDTQEPDPGRAELIAELFARLEKRESLRSIERDWEARGIVNGRGGPFSAQHLRKMAKNPTYAGMRVHIPGRTGYRDYRLGEANVSEGQWPALVTKRRFFAVQKFLDSPERHKHARPRPGGAVHFLSRIAKCDVCGSVVAVRRTHGTEYYTCNGRGCVSIDKAELDLFAEQTIFAALETDDLYSDITQHDDDNEDELARLRDKLAELRAQHRDLAAAVADASVSVMMAAQAEPEILASIAKAEKRERELSTPSILSGLIDPGADIATRWKDAVLSTRREIARLLFSAEVLGELRIVPKRNRFATCPLIDRVRFAKPDPDVS